MKSSLCYSRSKYFPLLKKIWKKKWARFLYCCPSHIRPPSSCHAIFKMYWNSKILLNCPLTVCTERPSFLTTFSLEKWWPYRHYCIAYSLLKYSWNTAHLTSTVNQSIYQCIQELSPLGISALIIVPAFDYHNII